MVAPAAAPSDSAALERRVLDVVAALVAELGGPVASRAPTLDDALDRDLGLGSLERVELLLRLEHACGVRLADDVMERADTPRDLVAALAIASPAMPEPLAPPRPPVGSGPPAPVTARTLPEVLYWHADADPGRVHVFLREDDGRERAITYGALRAGADAIGAGLCARGIVPGDRVALLLRTEAAFFEAFLGVLLAGAVPVPIYPPFRADRIEEYSRRETGILRNAEPRLLICFPEVVRVAGLLRAHVSAIESIATVQELAQPGERPPPVAARGEDPALIQYTSGSTGQPKGVLLSHANLLANIRAFGAAIAIRADDVAVSWLPLYHDMGLIGFWLGALYFGVPVAIMSPLAFLARPARWLRAMHGHRGTVSAAPNFAFELCVRKIRDDEIEGLDLSAWRVAVNGSESVSPDTIERFTRRFGPYGFRAESMCPVYGLAESSVALTIPPLGRVPRVDVIEREAFSRAHVARPAPVADASPLRFVSCGLPIAGHAVRVVDDAGNAVADRVEGRIQFRGPSVTEGYFRNVAATSAAVSDGWMDSGDLGYVADGELFVTGRRKDMIKKAGRNLYPQEVEELVGDLAGIRKGCVAAFGVPDPETGTERLVVIAESRETAPARCAALRAAVLDRVVAALGIPADVVEIRAPGTVLKTSSGKIRRSATRQAYVDGELGRGRAAAALQWTRVIAGAVGARVAHAASRAGAVVVGAYIALLLAFLVPLLSVAVLLAPSARAADGAVRRWCRLILALSGCRIDVEGLEHLLAGEPAVLVANHASYTDALVLLAALPKDFRFVAKRELLATPLVGTIIRKVGHLAAERVDLARSVADAAAASAALRAGTSLLFFPEGTFVQTPGLMPFRLGAFKAAVEAAHPVIPIAIRGTRRLLPGDAWLPRPGRIGVTVTPPLRPAGKGWPEMVRLRDEARAAIAAHCGEPAVAHGVSLRAKASSAAT
jgi:1-acyl-sn-glycerol-3-phosphate acyltransferase